MSNELKAVITALLDRMPWNVLKPILQSLELPTGHGGNNTKELVLKFSKENGSEQDDCAALKRVYKDTLLIGTKYVRIYKVDKNIAQSFGRHLDSIPLNGQGSYAEAYPFPIPADELLGLDDEHELVDVISNDDGSYCLLFCAKRYVTDKFDVSPRQLTDTAKVTLLGCDIVAVRKVAHQAFDALVVHPEAGIVEVRVDDHKSFHSDDIEQACNTVVQRVNAISTALVNVPLVASVPLNLFPLIDILYKASEGKVCELSFTTTESSVKNERMRREDLDLREETFHKGGKTAVNGNINPYKIAIRWEITRNGIESSPEMLLPGTFRLANQPNPALNHVRFSRIAGIEEYNFVASKIHDYLP